MKALCCFFIFLSSLANAVSCNDSDDGKTYFGTISKINVVEYKQQGNLVTLLGGLFGVVSSGNPNGHAGFVVGAMASQLSVASPNQYITYATVKKTTGFPIVVRMEGVIELNVGQAVRIHNDGKVEKIYTNFTCDSFKTMSIQKQLNLYAYH